MRPPTKGGAPSGRTNSNASISSRRASSGGSWSSNVREPACSSTVPSGPCRTSATGSSPRKEYRPQRSPPWTDSRRNAWEGVGSLRKALTGVSVSPGSSRHTGTRFPRAASRSKLARLIRVSRIGWAPYRNGEGGAGAGATECQASVHGPGDTVMPGSCSGLFQLLDRLLRVQPGLELVGQVLLRLAPEQQARVACLPADGLVRDPQHRVEVDAHHLAVELRLV